MGLGGASPFTRVSGCDLCRAAHITPWYHEDDICWIAECEICAVPMVVWRYHGTEPPPEHLTHMRTRLLEIATRELAGECYIDDHMRNIPDHYHAHGRTQGRVLRSRRAALAPSLYSDREANMAESELHRKGSEIRRRLLGDKYVERVNATTYKDPVMRTFIDVATENVFGALWTRPGLDLKTRTLVCVVSDAATGREPELRIHLRMALRQGWTETELIEVLIHLSGYVGVPVIREALICARDVFAEVKAEG